MSAHDAPCTGCGKETHHRSGKCMRCRSAGNDKPVVLSSDSNRGSYAGRGRRYFDMDSVPEMTLEDAIKRLQESVRAHSQNKRKFAALDRRAIETLLKEFKNGTAEKRI